MMAQMAIGPMGGPGNVEAAKPRLAVADVQYFKTGAVHPIDGQPKDTFVFAIKYQDTDGTPPKKGYPRLLIDIDHDGKFDTGDDLNLTMDPMSVDIPSYGLGVNYAREWVFDDPGTYSFAFYAINEKNETAFIGPFDGPVVLPPTHEYSDPMTTLSLYGLLTSVFCIVFFVLGMARGQEKARRNSGRGRFGPGK